MPRWIDPIKRNALYDRALAVRGELTCVYCGIQMQRGGFGQDGASLDHVVPRSVYAAGIVSGKAHVAGNLVCACRACNAERRDLTVSDFCALRGLEVEAVMGRINEELSHE